MKKYLILSLCTAIALIFIPLCFFGLAVETSTPVNKKPSQQQGSVSYASDTAIEVFNHRENIIQTMNFRDYIIGVVAAEMPVEFHSEALSAGAVTAATLARQQLSRGADPELMGAVISTDSSKHQAYMSIEEMKALWGDDFYRYYKKLSDAVDKSIDYSITYEDKLIVAAYHAISPGITEKAENVWLAGFPYLVSVESPGDELAPGYLTTVRLSHNDFRKEIEKQGAILSENSSEWISAGEYSEAGILLKMRIGNMEFSGKELRSIFGLRSPAVTLENTSEGITMTVKGYGHGVGMSQYGADYFAEKGYTWQEIITHYYPGVSLKKY